MSLAETGRDAGQDSVATKGVAYVHFEVGEILRFIDQVKGSDLSDGEHRYPFFDAHMLCDLRLRFGSAFVNAIDLGEKAGGYTLSLTASDLWLLIDKVKTTERSPEGVQTGIELLKKLYDGLLQLNPMD